jgi:hypothetical protein
MSRPRPAPRRASRSAVDHRAPADDESFKFKRAAALARAPDAIEALARAMPAPANAYDVPALRRLRGAASASERTEKRSAAQAAALLPLVKGVSGSFGGVIEVRDARDDGRWREF